MFGIFGKKENEALKVLNKIDEKSISELRKKIKILIVDDEEYDIFELLSTRGYQVYYKSDITYPIETEPFDLIVLDIKGVATKFGSTYGGFGFAKEVKMLYPNKIVICYSGTSDTKIMDKLNEIDDFIYKDTDIDNWANKLDSYIKKYSDINYQWSIIEKKLSEKKIDEKEIDELKECYIESLQTESFNNFKNKFNISVNDVKLYIEIIGSIFSLIKIFS